MILKYIMNVNCGTNYKKEPEDVKKNEKNPAARTGFFFFVSYKVTWSRCQISSTYCLMVRSEVNLPEQATFIIAM